VIKQTSQIANNMRPPEAWYNSYSSSNSKDTLARLVDKSSESMQSVTISAGIDNSLVLSDCHFRVWKIVIVSEQTRTVNESTRNYSKDVSTGELTIV
jgi:hypothetical protein